MAKLLDVISLTGTIVNINNAKGIATVAFGEDYIIDLPVLFINDEAFFHADQHDCE